MPASLTSDELRPYKTVLVASITGGNSATASGVLKKLKKELGVKSTGGRVVKSAGTFSDGTAPDDPEAAFVHYQDRRQVPWSKSPVVDVVNHLLVVVRRGDWVAIATTETSRRDTVTSALRRGKLGPLQIVRPGRIKDAFIKGNARTLWLKGTHRQTATKADTKVLGGQNLAPALDPIGDQTYRYTAIRCDPENSNIGEVMGLAIDQSRVWVGNSEDWDDFIGTIGSVLEQLEAASDSDDEPLPVLAAAKSDLAGVDGAYDIGVTPPELLVVGPVLDAAQAAQLDAMEQLAYGTKFEVTPAAGSALSAVATRAGVTLGGFDLEPEADGDEVAVSLRNAVAAAGQEAAFKQLLAAIAENDALTIYYDSGHVIQDRHAYAVRHRDLPYDGWAWVDFGVDWDVDREKPAAGIAAIGTDRSLFDWVLAEWPAGAGLNGSSSWLACDDRAGETADFLHLDVVDGIPTLSLIHAKGAGSASGGRQVSVVAYETVGAQAVKNLRHLDAALASGTLLSGHVNQALNLLAWQDGVQRTRDEFIDQLSQLGGGRVRRRVVILQPHMRRNLLETIRADESHTEAPRLRQLDTLLLSHRASCQSAGAELVVVGAAG